MTIPPNSRDNVHLIENANKGPKYQKKHFALFVYYFK